jgi:peroxisomal coenzyme A diphosphatase NUDT7
MIQMGEVTYLLFEKRSNKLRYQPGEICFPGGKIEIGESMMECAIRETVEELQVSQNQIEIIGPGDIFISPFNLIIHSFIGEIKGYNNTFSTDEVEEIIKVPIDFFRVHQPEMFESKLINELAVNFPYERIQGGTKYPWAKGTYDILFYQYESWNIWGLTAQIIRSAVKLIDEYHLK